MPGHLFEGNPVGEGTTRRDTDAPVHPLHCAWGQASLLAPPEWSPTFPQALPLVPESLQPGKETQLPFVGSQGQDAQKVA